MSRLLRLWTAFLLTAAATGACGGSDEPRERTQPVVQDEQRAVLGVVDELRAASRRGDAEAICSELFSRSLARSITRAAGRSCADEVRARFVSPDAEISVGREIRVTGQRATAVIREANGRQSALHLRMEDGGWRIDRVISANAGSG